MSFYEEKVDLPGVEEVKSDAVMELSYDNPPIPGLTVRRACNADSFAVQAHS
jgi:hypothetical protein